MFQTMTPAEFCDRHNACREGRVWAEQFSTMSDCWAALVADDEHYDWAWWVITRDGVLTPQERTALVCEVVRNTPLGDGPTVWDLLTDERYRRAVETAEAWARGEATDEELAAAEAAALAARAAAHAAALAAWSAARAARTAARAADAAAWAADAAAARDAWTAARAWQMDQLRAIPNPFADVSE